MRIFGRMRPPAVVAVRPLRKERRLGRRKEDFMGLGFDTRGEAAHFTTRRRGASLDPRWHGGEMLAISAERVSTFLYGRSGEQARIPTEYLWNSSLPSPPSTNGNLPI